LPGDQDRRIAIDDPERVDPVVAAADPDPRVAAAVDAGVDGDGVDLGQDLQAALPEREGRERVATVVVDDDGVPGMHGGGVDRVLDGGEVPAHVPHVRHGRRAAGPQEDQPDYQ